MNVLNDSDLFQYECYRIRDENGYVRFHCGEDYIKKLAELDGISVDEIHISGLSQKSFEYFISEYAEKFKVIELVHCALINDFSCFMNLKTVEYILINYNIKATSLWNMKNNNSLKGLLLDDTKKIVTLDDIKTAPKLEELRVAESVDCSMSSNRYRLNSLEPLTEVKELKRLSITVGKIIDEKIEPLYNIPTLQKLHVSFDLFEFEQYAELKAKAENVQITPDAPYISGDETVLVVGRGRRNLKINSPKLKLLQQEWDEYITKYKSEN